MARSFPVLACLAALALAACGSEDTGPAAPPQAADSLSSQADALLGGGAPAFRAQLAKLRGTPVVVNQWASWCGPCKFEFPFFAALAKRYEGRVAFLGVNSNDSAEAAKRFLAEHPTPFPHFSDPDVRIARTFRGGLAWPTTAFYDASGKLTDTHSGGYASEARLEEDIREFALR
ncbi:MAG: TlpA family protein disulfide reductase [Solirubrobacteraceae bacterium]